MIERMEEKKLATIPGNQNLRLVSQRWKRKN